MSRRNWGSISDRIDEKVGEGLISYKHRLKIWDGILKGPYLKIPIPYINILKLQIASLLTLFVKISEELQLDKINKDLKAEEGIWKSKWGEKWEEMWDKEDDAKEGGKEENKGIQWGEVWFSITTKQITERTSLSKSQQERHVTFLIEKNLIEKTRKNSLNYYRVNFEIVHNLINEYEKEINNDFYSINTILEEG